MYRESPSRLTRVTVWRSVASEGQLVVPDGCMDLLWLGGDLMVAGPDSVAQRGGVAAGTSCVGLRFAPGLLADLVGIPAVELADQRVPLDALWPEPEVVRLEEVVAAGTDPADALEAAAEQHRRRVGPPDPLIRAVCDRLAEGIPVAGVANEVGLSDRQLRRRCLAAFGYGAKTLARVLRFQHALDLAHSGLGLAAVAAEAGYADQPHFAREVRSLTDARPGDLVQPASSRGA